ncbi:type II toxin-antitoxin system VapC family toxin [Nocardiopsis sp. HUAS JQ3]|uniref:type II toxin-antitoxin system VapC family toxin n=1 Tax=Nocardiopsis sp. HUAS JQ3 TaxID=3061629 RepID=UPI0023AA10A5|nr:type II toxin-antitoxin system VapC family toxin [Nocardiopsis sp. HUAS JQ3]WDZ90989.1 type II toxin-antitoxin system VapC family toxin [Nocardiopsis sp. HUAS JQ3]
MICYFDTSAFVPLLIEESGSEQCLRLWEAADSVVSSRLLCAEAAAALAQAERMSRITSTAYTQAMELLEGLWEEVNVLDVDQVLVERAAGLAREFGLRGYDAVHCASVERLKSGELVVACGDRRLLDACEALGMATGDTSV